jgi:hypothetical protein
MGLSPRENVIIKEMAKGPEFGDYRPIYYPESSLKIKSGFKIFFEYR